MIQSLTFLSRSVVFSAIIALAACSGAPSSHDEHDDHGPEGPNGGHLIVAGDYSLEIKIEEAATPRFVAWAYHADKPLLPDKVRLLVDTERLGGAKESFVFVANEGRLVASTGVGEPHSFMIEVTGEIDGQKFNERYESFEGRTTIEANAAKDAGVVVAAVAPGDIVQSISANGVVIPRRGGEAVVTARFPGVVRRIDAEVGDRVAKGQALATVESDASLAEYVLRSPIAGTVVAREARIGESTAGEALFTVADLETLSVEMRLFGADASRVRVGARVRLVRPSDGAALETAVARVSPVIDTASQSVLVHTTIKNADRSWLPGTALRAGIEVRRTTVPIRVPVSALQKFGAGDVVFIRIGDVYEIRPVSIGRRSEDYAEILSGISVGDEIVVEQSYLIKADIEKSGAVHDH